MNKSNSIETVDRASLTDQALMKSVTLKLILTRKLKKEN